MKEKLIAVKCLEERNKLPKNALIIFVFFAVKANFLEIWFLKKMFAFSNVIRLKSLRNWMLLIIVQILLIQFMLPPNFVKKNMKKKKKNGEFLCAKETYVKCAV